MPGWKSQVKQRATELLKLPPDALLDVSRVTCIDAERIVVENARGLVKVEEQEIVLDLKGQTLYIRGHGFEVTLMTPREVHIQGRVSDLVYKDGRRES